MTPHPRLGTHRRHREHGGVPVFAGRQFHQRPDHRRRRRLEFDEVPVRLRAVLGMGGPLNLFALLDQAAARHGDRGAVYLGERQLHTWARAARPRAAARRLDSASSAPGRPDRRRQREPARDRRADVRDLGGRVRLRPDQLQAAPAARWRRSSTTPARAVVFASPKIAPAGRGRPACRSRRSASPEYESRWPQSRPIAAAEHRPGRAGLAVLHQRHHRPVQGRDAVAPQPDGDDGVAPRRLRLTRTRTAAWSTAPRCRTARASTSPPYVLRGARQVIPASAAFEPDEFLDLCEHHPGCSASSRRRWCSGWSQTGRPRPSNLRTVVYGGGPMYVDSLKKAMAAFGPIFVQLYGQGEAPMTITGLRRADHVDAPTTRCSARSATRGPASTSRCSTPTELRRISARSARSSAAVTSSCPGYWKNPDATAATLQNGWLHTGDMGSFDARGFLTLRDRVQGRGDQRRQQHLSARGRGGAARAPRRRRGRAWSARPTRSGARCVVAFIVGPVARRPGRPSAGTHRPVQAAQALRVRRRAAEAAPTSRPSFTRRAAIVGKSAAIRRAIAEAQRVAPTHATVLITGETRHRQGARRARASTSSSPRATGPFVARRTAPRSRETLLESELFGHEKGAFTGAARSDASAASSAPTAARCSSTRSASCRSTLQAKLLRVLQEREVERVGGSATDPRRRARRRRDQPRPRAPRSQAGRFREDLYYRLNVVPARRPAAARAPRGHPAARRALPRAAARATSARARPRRRRDARRSRPTTGPATCASSRTRRARGDPRRAIAFASPTCPSSRRASAGQSRPPRRRVTRPLKERVNAYERSLIEDALAACGRQPIRGRAAPPRRAARRSSTSSSCSGISMQPAET